MDLQLLINQVNEQNDFRLCYEGDRVYNIEKAYTVNANGDSYQFVLATVTGINKDNTVHTVSTAEDLKNLFN